MQSEIDRLYCMLLQLGFVGMREAMTIRDFQWVMLDVEFLHEVPTLIGEARHGRHAFFWTKQRPHYLETVTTSGSEAQKVFVRTFYGAVFEEMGPHFMAMGVEGN